MMKRVLITGANSYIGTSFEQWNNEHGQMLSIDTLDMKSDAWQEYDFRGYDAVFHVAGIAHADVGNATEEQKALYYKVNTDLTIACAKKAKADGVGQFIFMSSMIVYGASGKLGKSRRIAADTQPDPENFYGDSKLKAEEGIRVLNDETFKVVILRPPMIYGKGSKGNYPLLAKMAVKLPAFPDIQNERSMLYVGNLCKFVSLLLQNEEQGTFFPQNAEYVQTCHMVQMIAMAHHKKIHLTKLFNPAVILLSKTGGKFGRLADKAFGNMSYDMQMSVYPQEYRVYSLEESIQRTEQ